MERARSDKGKNKPNKPLDKPVDRPGNRKEKVKTGKADEGVSTSDESSGRVISENSAQYPSWQPTTRSKKRQEQQRIEIEQEPSADLRESEKVSEQMFSASAANGHQDIEDDSATHRRIAERAYTLFQENGCEHGNDWSDWFEAERQIKETRM